MDYPKVPKRIILDGDRATAMTHIGEAESLLNLCRNMAALGGIQQYRMNRVLNDGTLVSVMTLPGGQSVVRIVSPLQPKEEEEDKISCDPWLKYFKLRLMRTDGTEITPSHMTGGLGAARVSAITTEVDGETYEWEAYKRFYSEGHIYHRWELELTLNRPDTSSVWTDELRSWHYNNTEDPWYIRGLYFRMNFRDIKSEAKGWRDKGLLSEYCKKDDILVIFNENDLCWYLIYGFAEDFDGAERYLLGLSFVQWDWTDNDWIDDHLFRGGSYFYCPTEVTEKGIRYNDRAYRSSTTETEITGDHGEPSQLKTYVAMLPNQVCAVDEVHQCQHTSGREHHVYEPCAAYWLRDYSEHGSSWQGLDPIAYGIPFQKAYTSIQFKGIEVERWELDFTLSKRACYHSSDQVGLKGFMAFLIDPTGACCNAEDDWTRLLRVVEPSIGAPCGAWEDRDTRITCDPYTAGSGDEGRAETRGWPRLDGDGLRGQEPPNEPVAGTVAACPELIDFEWVVYNETLSQELYRKGCGASYYIDTNTDESDNPNDAFSFDEILTDEDWEMRFSQQIEYDTEAVCFAVNSLGCIDADNCVPTGIFYYSNRATTYRSGGTTYGIPGWVRYKSDVRLFSANASNVNGSLIRFKHSPEEK